MKNKKSLIIYFSVVILLVVMCYGLKNTFAFFVANGQGTATNIKVAKLTYKLESDSLIDNSLTLKPYEIKKINIVLTNDYDIATVYRLNYNGNVFVEKSSTSKDEVKNIIDSKQSKNIDLIITNKTDKEQTVSFYADGGYVGNELADGNITNIYDETLLMNKLLVDGTLTLTENNDYRDIVGTNNYLKIDETIYRVLGAFKEEDNLYLKVITNETIGKHLFGENNNYLTSTLNTYLNVDYKDSLNSLLKDNLKEVVYYTAGLDKLLISDEELIISKEKKELEEKETYYNYERGTLIADESFNASGKTIIGLMYLSDYEYAAKWINKNYNELTIVPNIKDKESMFCIKYTEEKKMENEKEIIVPKNEITLDCKVSAETDVRPVMFIENNLIIDSGTGTEADPYIVK